VSFKTRLEALEKRLAKSEPTETVVRVRVIVVRNRAEVEQLRAAGLIDSREAHRPVARGPVRAIIEKVVEARELLRDHSSIARQGLPSCHAAQ
jgi:hypothetical protein